MQSAVFRAPQFPEPEPEPEPEVFPAAQNHRPQMVRAPIASKATGASHSGQVSADIGGS